MSFPLSLFNGREGLSPEHDSCLLQRRHALRSSIGEVDFVDVGLLLTREEFMAYYSPCDKTFNLYGGKGQALELLSSTTYTNLSIMCMLRRRHAPSQ